MTTADSPLRADHRSQLFRLFRNFAEIGALVCATNRTLGGQRVTTPTPSDSVRTLWIAFQEQGATDADRANVARLLALTKPISEWRKISVPDGESKQQTIRRTYHFFEAFYPTTTSTLISIIGDANGKLDRWAGTSIAIPPMIVSADTFYHPKGKTTFRLFDPGAEKYASFVLGDTAWGSRFWSSGSFVGAQDEAFKSAPVREANVTLIPVSRLTPEIAAVLRRFSHHVFTFTQGAQLTMELLGGASLDQCHDGEKWFSNSDYASVAQTRIANLKITQLPKLIAAAHASPLVIVDWDFQKGGHGQQVRDVVSIALRQFGLPELDSEVRTVELNPKYGRDTTVIVNYLKSIDTTRAFDAARQLRDSAIFWIKTAKPVISDNKVDINELALKAMLWSAFKQGNSIFNLSFAIVGGLLQLQPLELGHKPTSIVLLAAGNSPHALDPFSSLQNAASDHIINVTAGSQNGHIRGTFSDSTGTMIVSTFGPACGYQSPSMGLDDWGSSYASPYVATAAWLATVIGDVPRMSLRQAVLAASIPDSHADYPVQAGGAFDSALLLSGRAFQPHVVRTDGMVANIDSMIGSFSYQDAQQRIVTDSFVPGQKLGSPRAIVPSSCGQTFCVIDRSVSPVSSLPPVARSLQTAVFKVFTDKGIIEVSSPQDFYTKIRRLWN